MKKSLLVLAALAALSMVFVSCGGGGNSGSKPVEPEDNTVKTGIIFGDAVYKFADLTIADAYGSSGVITVNADGTLSVKAGSWDSFTVTLPSTLDLSNVKVAVTAKVEADYSQGDNKFKIILAEDDNKQSEITSNEEGNSGWCDPLTTEFATYTATDSWAAWQKEEADLTKISKIIINPQSASGVITIQSIELISK